MNSILEIKFLDDTFVIQWITFSTTLNDLFKASVIFRDP